MDHFSIPGLSTLQMEEMQYEENRVKMCYAFARAPYFYHQEITVLNPRPSLYVPNMVAPNDLYLYHYVGGAGEVLRPEEEIQALVCSNDAPIVCTGSHTPALDRSIQLFALPPDAIVSGLEAADLLVVQFLCTMSETEKSNILDRLRKAYYELDACN